MVGIGLISEGEAIIEALSVGDQSVFMLFWGDTIGENEDDSSDSVFHSGSNSGIEKNLKIDLYPEYRSMSD